VQHAVDRKSEADCCNGESEHSQQIPAATPQHNPRCPTIQLRAGRPRSVVLVSLRNFGVDACALRDRCNLLANRPTNEQGERVTPSDLGAHRLSHAMRGPCCLCPLNQRRANDFQEAAMYLVRRGRFMGEYVAACANSECGYLGE
jgi:hypothetical protein